MYFYYIISKKGHMNRGIIQFDDLYNPYENNKFLYRKQLFQIECIIKKYNNHAYIWIERKNLLSL